MTVSASRRMLRACVAILLAFGCGSPRDDTSAVRQGLAAVSATCAAATGTVEVRRAGTTTWEPVTVGATFRGGDEIRANPLSSARIELIAGGTLLVEASSSVLLGEAARSGEPAAAAVSVQGGVVRAELGAGKDGTAAAPLVIRGTDGAETQLVPTEENGKAQVRLTRAGGGTEIALTKGKATVVGKDSNRALAEGEKVDLGARGVGQKAELIPFPESVEPGIDARFLFRPGLRIRLGWQQARGARGYRVQIARDMSFRTMEAVADVQGSSYEFVPSDAGLHVWRVAARDGQGGLGEYGFARRLYCERNEPRDLLVGPMDGSTVHYAERPPRIGFWWESAGAARRYRLLVSSGADLHSRPVVSMVSPEQHVEAELAPGRYQWGVYVLEGREELPIFVKPRQLTIRKTTAPKAEVPKRIRTWGR